MLQCHKCQTNLDAASCKVVFTKSTGWVRVIICPSCKSENLFSEVDEKPQTVTVADLKRIAANDSALRKRPS